MTITQFVKLILRDFEISYGVNCLKMKANFLKCPEKDDFFKKSVSNPASQSYSQESNEYALE